MPPYDTLTLKTRISPLDFDERTAERWSTPRSELEKAKRLLAEMNASEAVQDKEMDEQNPQRLSAALRKRACAELEDDSGDGEAFDFEEVDAMSDSSDGEITAKGKVAKKAGKGGLSSLLLPLALPKVDPVWHLPRFRSRHLRQHPCLRRALGDTPWAAARLGGLSFNNPGKSSILCCLLSFRMPAQLRVRDL
ncbi:hypothetical protein BDZ97DRAFT_1921256 [Flammula alnicola]|nr:hypothetical protein BDZ97DRAFT_1921256 [Flammula alnicola]